MPWYKLIWYVAIKKHKAWTARPNLSEKPSLFGRPRRLEKSEWAFWLQPSVTWGTLPPSPCCLRCWPTTPVLYSHLGARRGCLPLWQKNQSKLENKKDLAIQGTYKSFRMVWETEESPCYMGLLLVPSEWSPDKEKYNRRNAIMLSEAMQCSTVHGHKFNGYKGFPYTVTYCMTASDSEPIWIFL